MDTLFDILKDAELSNAEFQKKYVCPFLMSVSAEATGGTWGGFNTTAMDLTELRTMLEKGAPAPSEAGEVSPAAAKLQSVQVAQVLKGPTNPFKNRIFVGRTKSSDITIPSNSISKSHAFFELDEAAQRYFLTDNGSTNGTKLNGVALVPMQKAPLTFDDLISFAALEYRFVQAIKVWTRLRELR